MKKKPNSPNKFLAQKWHVLTVVGIVILAAAVLLIVRPGTQSTQNEENFWLSAGENVKIVSGENEVVLVLENVGSDNRANVTYTIGGETKQGVFGANDTILSTSKFEVTLTFLSFENSVASFRLNGDNFQVQRGVISIANVLNNQSDYENKTIMIKGTVENLWMLHSLTFNFYLNDETGKIFVQTPVTTNPTWDSSVEDETYNLLISHFIKVTGNLIIDKSRISGFDVDENLMVLAAEIEIQIDSEIKKIRWWPEW